MSVCSSVMRFVSTFPSLSLLLLPAVGRLRAKRSERHRRAWELLRCAHSAASVLRILRPRCLPPVCVCTDVNLLRKPRRFSTSFLPNTLRTIASRRQIRRGITYWKSPPPSPYVLECSVKSLKEGQNRGFILR